MRYSLLPPPGVPTDPASITSLFAALDAIAGKVEQSTWTFYDTPDRLLWLSQHVLVQRKQTLALIPCRELSVGTPVASLTRRSSALARLLADWPASNLKHALLPLVRIRSLSPLLVCKVERRTATVRDALEKTVALIEVWQVQPTDGSGHMWATVTGLRGYKRERLATIAAAVECGWQVVKDEPFMQFTSGFLAPDPAAAQGFPDGGVAAGQAMRSYLGEVLAALPELERGVIDDLDTEFLHQFRLLLRRARSLAAQFASVFLPQQSERIRVILAGWARCSNHQRDLDVWLLARSEHEALVPKYLRPGLAGMFRLIARDRAAAHREVVTRLSSATYQAERAELAALIADAPDGPDAALTLVELARQRTWKSYRRVVREARQIDSTTQAEIVHAVRIRCKKLRYLLDSCGQLTAPDHYRALRDQLKAVQSLLGAYNDDAVQCQALLERAQAHRDEDAALLAIGALVGAVDRHRADLHAQLLRELGELSQPATRASYRNLFRTKE